ncbi:DNA adenine methylase [Methylobacterium gregans]|uniref:Phage DNA methylase n=1 Tax=Methylobacterium gregans TaxID=374424 RepID=A0AA37HNW7_9HYPH|nr:DNA adenine methylase [Methylobacterium gregans]MDQ0518846.1 site-specific DNA-adenine methylase [Methylobacterium gregans]GJD79045.1 hypothetical protein NBEOAGPD_2265 [Methylobacterium gregans]GLS57249.1 hypothetical protein GCM10007886_54350 [Methylobacterium gregans]
MRYPGGKGRCYRQIIAQMPAHTTYIETHLGGGAVLRAKRPAARTIGLDVDATVFAAWRDRTDVELLQIDACTYLRTFPFTGQELVYADPPYLASTRRRSRVYRHDYTDAQHVELLALLTALPCAAMISGYPSSLYDDMLAHWRRIEFVGDSHVGPRTEVLWLNFPAPATLHDHSFLGRNFREREAVRRRRSTILNRIDGLDGQERQAVFEHLAIAHGDALRRALRREP